MKIKIRSFNSLPRPTSTLSQIPSEQHLLSSCKDLSNLLQLHAHFITSGFKINCMVKTHLVNLYASFGKCHFSRLVFDSEQNPPLILWNSMIRAYNRTNQYRAAIQMYDLMTRKGFQPDKYTFTFVLKACTEMLDLEKGRDIHDDVSRRNLECDVFIGTGLVSLYCKTGNLKSAREMFDKMPKKDVVAWNAMISGFSQSSEPTDALEFFKYMQFSCGVQPNSVSLLNLFPAVCKLMDGKICRSIHGFVYRREFPISVYNGLIDMYSKCGHSNVAHHVFYQMRVRDDVSWGTVMAGYAYTGNFLEVLELFDCMKREDLKMNKVSAVSALLGAAEMRDLEKGVEIHNYTIQEGIDSDIMIATSLMTMYAKCGQLEKTKELFRVTQERDLVAWSAVIAAFAQSGYPEEALSVFRDMQHENLLPNNVTLVSVLPACGELMAVKLGKGLHCYAVKAAIDSDLSTGTALVSMYAKCCLFPYALGAFNKMPFKEVITWNALINGYAQTGDSYHALEMFSEMRLSGLQPDPGSMVGVIPACALLGDIYRGTYIHGQVIKYGFESDCHVTNALVDLYAKCGKLSSAEFLFRNSFAKDEVSWNTMIAGYVQNECAKEAISAFRCMVLASFQPNVVTVVSILPAMSYLTALKEGMAMHAYIVKKGFLFNTLIGNSLIDMYGKCGHLDMAEHVFLEMKNRDTVSWNAMLAAYSVHGNVDHALSIFSHMQENDVEIDSVSFISVLSACRHAGMIQEGRSIFQNMQNKYHLKPELPHYACMVDLLGRAGLFDETMDLIKNMPMKPDAAVWGALLGASRMHSNVELAELALKHLINLEVENPTHYVELSNIYSQSGRWFDARNTRVRMQATGLKKIPGRSWVK
ncbi:PREDICTED: pentatricopeptide repeat-containing protein At2g39620 isoform X2 [Ipomoea nil]|nr:PREDICTED: pentatricopeptide repeat-containing protein At2g39620 isoform X2 [Ipomoea nil]